MSSYTAPGSTSIFSPGIKLGPTGNPFAGVLSDARRGPSYPVFAGSHRLQSSALGPETLRRIHDSQATGQAYRSAIPARPPKGGK